MTPELKTFLERIAALPACNDDEDFMVEDRAGGNVDDAYCGGQNDGEILLARQLLKEFEPGADRSASIGQRLVTPFEMDWRKCTNCGWQGKPSETISESWKSVDEESGDWYSVLIKACPVCRKPTRWRQRGITSRSPACLVNCVVVPV